jgi:hypothetical protein
MTVRPLELPSRPNLRDLRPLKYSRSARLPALLRRLPRVQRSGVLASLPVLSCLFAVLAAWDVARPLGLAVASASCLLLEFRFNPEE